MNENSLLRSLFDEDNWEAKLNPITESIIGNAYKVSNTLGCGFLEKVYENALALEMRNQGFSVEQQKDIRVFYEGVEVGLYSTDLLVNESVLVELKAVHKLNEIDLAQCLNYLKATGFKICLLINFGNPRVEVKRIVL